MKRVSIRYFVGLLLLGSLAMLAGCTKGQEEGPAGSVIAASRANNLTATLANSKGYLSEGQNEFTLEFKNDSGQPVDVGAITLYFDMPAMGSMPYMKNDAVLTTTNTPGVYRGTVTLEMKGTWQTKLSYQGPAGNGQMTFTINAK